MTDLSRGAAQSGWGCSLLTIESDKVADMIDAAGFVAEGVLEVSPGLELLLLEVELL